MGIKTTLALAAALLSLVPAVARAQQDDAKVITMDVGDEPGRVSPEEVRIEDGPYKRQVVFYRTTAKPGTIVVATPERFLYLVLGDNKALRYGIGVGARASNGRAWSRSPARPNGRIGRRRRR